VVRPRLSFKAHRKTGVGPKALPKAGVGEQGPGRSTASVNRCGLQGAGTASASDGSDRDRHQRRRPDPPIQRAGDNGSRPLPLILVTTPLTA